MKRLYCIMLALLLFAMLFSGCGGSEQQASVTDESTDAHEAEPTAEATAEPTAEPSAEPTAEPTAEPVFTPIELYAGMPGRTIEVCKGLTLAIKEDGTILADDADGWRDLSGFADWNGMVSISTNGDFTAGLREDGTVNALYFSGNPSPFYVVPEGMASAVEELAKVDDAAMVTVDKQWVGVIHENGTVSLVKLTWNDPPDISSWTDIVDLVLSDFRVYGLKKDGTIIGTRLYELNGELIQEDFTYTWENVVSIEPALQRICAVCADGTAITSAPMVGIREEVAALSDVSSVSGDRDLAVFLKNDGTVELIEADYYDERDIDTSDWRDIVAVACDVDRVVGVKNDGTLVMTGKRGDELMEVLDWQGVKDISAAGSHVVGLREDGTVIAAGSNIYNECGVSDWKNVIQVSAGNDFTAALTSEGEVLFTEPDNEMLGHDFDTSGWHDVIEIAAGSCLLGLRSDGKVYITGILQGYNEVYEDGSKLIRGLTDMVSITGGYDYAVGKTSDGRAKTKGWYNWWKLDVSKWRNVSELSMKGPICLGLKKDGTVYAGGDIRPWTHVDEDADRGPYAEFYEGILKWKDITSVAAGETVYAGLKEDGTVKAEWTYDYLYDQLGDTVASWSDITALSAAGGHLIGQKADGSIVAAGLDGFRPSVIADWEGIIH